MDNYIQRYQAVFQTYCQLEGDKMFSLLVDFLMSDNNGLKKIYRKKEGVSAGLNNEFRYSGNGGQNPGFVEEYAESTKEEILDYKSLIHLLKEFYFCNGTISNNYTFKFQVNASGMFKIVANLNREIYDKGSYREYGDRTFDLVAKKTEKDKKYAPYYWTSGWRYQGEGLPLAPPEAPPGGYSWKRYIDPEYMRLKPKTVVRNGKTVEIKTKRLKDTVWFPKIQEEIEKLASYICEMFDATVQITKLNTPNLKRNENNRKRQAEFNFARDCRFASKAYFIEFLKVVKEYGPRLTKELLTQGLSDSLQGHLARRIYDKVNKYNWEKIDLDDLYNERDFENNPLGLSECVSRAINNFLYEEFKDYNFKQRQRDYKADKLSHSNFLDKRPRIFAFQDHYNSSKHGEIEELAHAVKEGDKKALETASDYLSALVYEDNAVFIPIPNHNGYADYTLAMAKLIAQKRNGECVDILSSNKREMVYTQKIQGLKPQLKFRGNNNIYNLGDLSQRTIYLVDNVIDSGTTYKEAFKVLAQLLGQNLYETSVYLLVLANTDKCAKKYKIHSYY